MKLRYLQARQRRLGSLHMVKSLSKRSILLCTAAGHLHNRLACTWQAVCLTERAWYWHKPLAAARGTHPPCYVLVLLCIWVVHFLAFHCVCNDTVMHLDTYHVTNPMALSSWPLEDMHLYTTAGRLAQARTVFSQSHRHVSAMPARRQARHKIAKRATARGW